MRARGGAQHCQPAGTRDSIDTRRNVRQQPVYLTQGVERGFMARPNIEADVRTEKGKNAARRARMGGKVPAVLYGAGGETVALSLDPRPLLAGLHSQSGHNTIFDLKLKGGEASPAMVVEGQYDPGKGRLLHVDLKRIAMDKRLKVAIPIITTGEAKGVKQQSGILEVVM